MRRYRNTKIVATLGPSSRTKRQIRSMIKAGVDVFRLNFSHGSHEDHRSRFNAIRQLEKELDLIEANEAFAAQACAVNKDMGWDTEKVNVNGGAIALGHPIGASGARVLITLLHEMQKRAAKKGLTTLCIGGGMGVAMCIERD